MKIIHTGDWHIGKIVNEFSMIPDQGFILREFLKVIKEENPDAIVIAGDLYDRSIPPIEAVELLNDVFTKILNEYKIPILAIGGNHDGGERISFGNKLFKNNGLYIEGVLKKDISKVSLKDQFGNVNFYLIPYADPSLVRHIYEDSDIKTHEDGMRKIIENIKSDMNLNERNIAVAHGYVTYVKEKDNNISEEANEDYKTLRAGMEISDSERPLSIGGTDLINGDIFKDFTYTALGHLHGPQKVGSDRIRYSGSLLKYSFSETHQKKSITIINIDKNGELDVKIKPMISLRDMRIIKGNLEEIIKPEVYNLENKDDYIYAILTDEGEIIDPISKLRSVYPNVMGLSREYINAKESSRTSASNGYKNRTKLELFKEFYNSITGKELDNKKEEVMTKIIEEVEKEEI